jgi:hypothetical protein
MDFRRTPVSGVLSTYPEACRGQLDLAPNRDRIHAREHKLACFPQYHLYHRVHPASILRRQEWIRTLPRLKLKLMIIHRVDTRNTMKIGDLEVAPGYQCLD